MGVAGQYNDTYVLAMSASPVLTVVDLQINGSMRCMRMFALR